MRSALRFLLLAALAPCLPSALFGQSLSPRAYVITPVDTNVFNVTWTFNTGAIQLNNTAPITGADGTVNEFLPTYYHALSFFGRSANVLVGLPYAVGTFEGLVVDHKESTYRSGIGDGLIRFFGELEGWSRDEDATVHKMEAKDAIGRQPFRADADGPVQPHQADKHRRQSLGLQTGVRLFPEVGQLGSRCIRWGMVLYHQL